jgi:hypothetical protein
MRFFKRVLVLCLIIFFNCEEGTVCNNRFDYLTEVKNIPILKLHEVNTATSFLEQLESFYKEDLCNRCEEVEFKIPFKIEDKKGYLKMIADYNYPYCSNCGIAMLSRSYFQIATNVNNQISIPGKVVNEDSLKYEIYTYLSKVGVNEDYPDSIKEVNYVLLLDSKNIKLLNSIITSICKAHLNYVEFKVNESGVNFCKLSKASILQLKDAYPLRILFLPKFELPAPHEYEKYLKTIDKESINSF